MTEQLANIWHGILNNSLWIAALGLMLASSGIDGAYLAKMMEKERKKT